MTATPTEPADNNTRAFTAPPGGIMTKEVGAITGAVQIWIKNGTTKIRYKGAKDTYTVTGDLKDMTLEEAHEALQLDPGQDSDGNAKSVDLDTRRRLMFGT